MAGDVEAGDPGRPAGRWQQRREDSERRRLAGAVRAQEAEYLAFRDLQIDPGDGLDFAGLFAAAFERPAKPRRLDDGLAVHRAYLFLSNLIAVELISTSLDPAPDLRCGRSELSRLALAESQAPGIPGSDTATVSAAIPPPVSLACSLDLLRYTFSAQCRQ